MSKEDILAEIKNKMDTLGDLPVFSASVNKICNVSSDPDADAMSLSKEVLKDANLSVKLLRLSNSVHYNRGVGKIDVISRAVVLLGFNTVKNLSLTMKLIDSFQHEHPSIDMDKLLVKAYISAGFVRDLSMKIGIKDAEATYTCALLHDLGEIAVAYFLPDKYIEIMAMNEEGVLMPRENEKAILGATISTIGKELASSWNFSNNVISTMEHEPLNIDGQITRPNELNRALANLGSKIVSSLYSDNPSDEADLQSLMADLSSATGVSVTALETSLTNSFKMSCELAQEYGLARKKMMPNITTTGDDVRDKLASQFSFFAQNQPAAEVPTSSEPETQAVSDDETNLDQTAAETESDTSPANQQLPATTEIDSTKQEANLDPMLQLQFIQDITALITDSAKLNTVLIKVLEGINTAIGFTRVVLCLLSADRKTYVARITIGTDKELMKDYFNKNIDPDHDIFSRVLIEGADVFVEDVNDKRWKDVLPPKFETTIGAHAFVSASLRSGVKPLGLIYADKDNNKQPISKDQHRGFIQFVAQARLALQICR